MKFYHTKPRCKCFNKDYRGLFSWSWNPLFLITCIWHLSILTTTNNHHHNNIGVTLSIIIISVRGESVNNVPGMLFTLLSNGQSEPHPPVLTSDAPGCDVWWPVTNQRPVLSAWTNEKPVYRPGTNRSQSRVPGTASSQRPELLTVGGQWTVSG